MNHLRLSQQEDVINYERPISDYEKGREENDVGEEFNFVEKITLSYEPQFEAAENNRPANRYSNILPRKLFK